MANALAFRCVAYSFSLVQRVRHVISESALLKNPLAVGSSKGRQRCEQENNQCFLYA